MRTDHRATLSIEKRQILTYVDDMALGLQPEPEFLSAKEAAERIGRSYFWLFRARKVPGRGPPYYQIGGRYFYRPQEIMTWLRSVRST